MVPLLVKDLSGRVECKAKQTEIGRNKRARERGRETQISQITGGRINKEDYQDDRTKMTKSDPVPITRSKYRHNIMYFKPVNLFRDFNSLTEVVCM